MTLVHHGLIFMNENQLYDFMCFFTILKKKKKKQLSVTRESSTSFVGN